MAENNDSLIELEKMKTEAVNQQKSTKKTSGQGKSSESEQRGLTSGMIFYNHYKTFYSVVMGYCTKFQKFSRATLSPQNTAVVWRDLFRIIGKKYMGDYRNRATDVLCGTMTTEMAVYDVNGNDDDLQLNVPVFSVAESFIYERTYTASKTVTQFIPGFNGVAMQGEIISGLRTDTSVYSAQTPVRLAQALGTAGRDITLGSDCTVIYTKAMLYMMAIAQIFSPSLSDFLVEGCRTSWANVIHNTDNQHWPFSTASGQGQAPVVLARIVSVEDFANYVTGGTQHVNNWHKEEFGNSIAIIPVYIHDLYAPDLNTIWPLLFMQYPIMCRRTTGTFYNGDVLHANGSARYSLASCVRIPGPYAQVLFVVVDAANKVENLTYQMHNQVNVSYAGNYLMGGNSVDIGPTLVNGYLNLIEHFDGLLVRVQKYFPDKQSFIGGLTLASELCWRVPRLINKGSGGALFISQSFETRLPDGTAVFPVADDQTFNWEVPDEQDIDDALDVSSTSPMGMRARGVDATANNAHAFTATTHRVSSADVIATVAYAARYWVLGMDDFDIPVNLLDLYAATYRIAMVMTCYHSLSFTEKGFDLFSFFYPRRIRNYNVAIRGIESNYDALIETLGWNWSPIITTNTEASAGINAQYPTATPGGRLYAYPSNRVSMMSVNIWLTHNEPRYATQRAVSIPSSTKFVLHDGVQALYWQKYHGQRQKVFSLPLKPDPMWDFMSLDHWDETDQIFITDESGVLTATQLRPYSVAWADFGFEQTLCAVGYASQPLVEFDYGPYCAGGMFCGFDMNFMKGVFLGSQANIKIVTSPLKGILNVGAPCTSETMINDEADDQDDVDTTDATDAFGTSGARRGSFRT